jgi:hypothetical protein
VAQAMLVLPTPPLPEKKMKLVFTNYLLAQT